MMNFISCHTTSLFHCPIGLRAKILTVMLLALSALEARSSDIYIRDGSTGNGSDWAQALDELPATLVRGDTYWIADGVYAGRTFSTPPSTTMLITIKKATAVDHGTTSGWLDSYGDGQAAFGNIEIESDYWIMDGNSVPNYGFKISSSSIGQLRIGRKAGGGIDHVTIRSVTIRCAGSGVQNSGGISTYWACSDLTFEHLEVWDADGDPIATTNLLNSTFDHCYIHTRSNGGFGSHGDAWQAYGGSNVTVRNCRFNWQGQQLFFCPTGGGTWPGRWDVYGNQFYGGPTAGKGIHVQSVNGVTGPIHIYNNTFNGVNVGMTLGGNTSGYVRNNIFNKLGGNVGFGGTIHDFNWFGPGLSTSGEANAQSGSDPFVNESGNDYRLRGATSPGSPLSSTYQRDPLGSVRGADGTWDRGAFEFAGAVQPPAQPMVTISAVEGSAVEAEEPAPFV